jgi:glyoxylase-like metal-dependent hydrolase (beta-lactamase superfamily II)
MSDKLRQVNDHIWVYPHDPDASRMQPCVGVITTPTQTVLIDAGNSPRHARSILIALREMGVQPVSHVIYTHHHWDHTFGGQVWGGIVVGHEQTRDLLRNQYASKPWSSLYIQEEISSNPMRKTAMRALDRAVDDWRAFQIVLPMVTFTHEMMLYLDGLTLELRHVGGQHAADSITVRVREANVLFVGDCYLQPPPHLRKLDDTVDGRMIHDLLEQDADVYVEGHSDPMTRAEFQSHIKHS